MAKLLHDVTEEGALLDAFAAFGPVREIRLVRDKVTKASRGFAFIEFHDLAAARAATESRDPIMIDGATVRICFARDVKSHWNGGGAGEWGGVGDVCCGNPAFEFTKEQAANAHMGPKRAGFGIPPGFLPDQVLFARGARPELLLATLCRPSLC